MGLQDRGMEGQFRLNDGSWYDPKYVNPDLYEWNSGEPNDFFDEDCVTIGDNGGLNDEDCGTSFYGLCAIKVYNC